MKKAYLVLENGEIFQGWRFGGTEKALGEAVFTTGMGGYLETLTDPSYAGQIILQTFPLIGNYGVIPEDFEGKCAARGYVVRHLCDTPSNFRSQGTLGDLLEKWNIPGICGVDTRRITRILREQGVMNACICDAVPENLDFLKSYRVDHPVEKVSCRKKTEYPAVGRERFRVTLIDYGAKKNILRSLCNRSCRVTAVPWDTSAEEILADNPDGVMLSNGPGDPQDNAECVRVIAALLGKVPIFGICLGHQLIALAMGGDTVKLKYGHRGANQPVTDLARGRTYMTSQNHGYAVVGESLTGRGVVTHVNANDGTCEGVEYPGLDCFTVQFHPEACAGPRDTEFLFDQFLQRMGGRKHA